MAITQPILDTLTLPWPADSGGYTKIPRPAQATEIMYDNTTKTLSIGAIKIDYRLHFHGVPTPDNTNIKGKRGKGSVSFTDMEGTVRTVIMDEDTYQEETSPAFDQASGLVHHISFTLMEV